MRMNDEDINSKIRLLWCIIVLKRHTCSFRDYFRVSWFTVLLARYIIKNKCVL